MGATKEYVEDLLEQQRKARLEAANREQHDPDEAARMFGVQAVTNLPLDVVKADLPNLEKKVKAQEFNYDDYTDRINGAPAFNRFVAENPYHLSVLERDHKNLSSLERAYRQMSLSNRSGWAMTEIAEIRNRQLDNFENPDNEKDKKRLADLNQLLEGGQFGADNLISKVLVGTAQQSALLAWMTMEAADEMLIGTTVGAARGAFVAGTSTAGVGTLVGAGVGAVTGLGYGARAGFAEASFRLERGLAYDEYMGMGLNEEEARWASSAVGGVNAALEMIGLGAMTKRIPGIDKILHDRVGGVINSVLTKPTMRQAVGRATLMYGEGIATELLTEVAQEATLMAAGELLKANERGRGNNDPGMDSMESGEFWGRVGDIAAHTMYGVALIGGIGPTANLIRDSGRARSADKYGVALDTVGERAEASETRKNAGTVYEQFVDRLAGKDKKIIIEARRFIDYFQEQGMDAEQVAQSVGISVKELGDAEVAGMDIEIPAGQYLAKIAPSPHHKGLAADIKENSGAMSINEAQIYRKKVKLTLEEIRDLAAKEDPAQAKIDADLVEKLKARLVETGASPEAAEHQAMLMVGIPNLARRAGKDPEQFWHERFGGVVTRTNAQMRADRDDVDLAVDPYLDKVRAGDFPNQRDIFGPSLTDMLKQRGGLAMDAELDAQDIRLQIRGLIKDAGDTMDGAAEIAHEQGYIAARDPELLLEAIIRESEGEPVFGTQFNVKEDQRDLLASLEDLERVLEENGIDIQDMSNKEVRDALKALKTYHQDDTKINLDEVQDLADFVFLAAEHDPQMLARAAAMLPVIAPIQEFGDVQFVDDVTIDGKPTTHSRAANVEFERAKKRKNVLDKLKDCLGG